MIVISVSQAILISPLFSLFSFRSDCIELDFKEISYLVWVLDLALISLLQETEQTEPHHEVVLKSTQFCLLSLDTHL